MKNIQTNLLSAFEASGLTYDELAKRTNLPKSALYRYINGDTEKIPIDRFQAICNELHVDARSLLGWTGGGDPTNPNLHLFGEQPPDDRPVSPEARILAKGIDKLEPAQREQALAVIRAMFANHADYFEKENLD